MVTDTVRIDRSPDYWREHFQLDALALGANVSVLFGYVVRVKPREYCLHHEQGGERCRWGTAAEIAEDIAHLAQTGVLPKANGGRW
jgi:hypothetical protein